MKTQFVGTWNQASRMAVAAVLVCVSQAAWAEDKPAATAPEAALVLQGAQTDDLFEQYVSLSHLGSAWRNLDAAAMTDSALQFAEAERVLLRSHGSIKASQVFDLAIRVATERGDKASLARLAKSLERSGDKDRLAQVNLAMQAAGTSRAVDPVLTGGDFNSQLAIQYVQAEIQSACAAGSKSHLEVIAKSLPDLPVSEPQRVAMKRRIVEAEESLVENSQSSQAVDELDRLGGVVRPISEVKGPIGSKFKMIEYLSEKPDDAELIAMAKNATPESMMVKGIDDPLSALSMVSRGGQTPAVFGVKGMATIHQWVNSDGRYSKENCGTAAIATLMTRYGKGSKFAEWSNPNPVQRIENDGYGPDVAFGKGGTSRWRMESIATKYNFNYGWGTESQLNGYLAAGKPVAVMLDIGKCKAWGQWGFHWVVVYAYDSNNYYVTNWPTQLGAVPKAEFLDGWKNNGVAWPMGIAGRFLAITPK